MKTKNQIAFIIVQGNNRAVGDYQILKDFKCDSDHRIITCTLQANHLREKNVWGRQSSSKGEMMTKNKEAFGMSVGEMLRDTEIDEEDIEDISKKNHRSFRG